MVTHRFFQIDYCNGYKFLLSLILKTTPLRICMVHDFNALAYWPLFEDCTFISLYYNNILCNINEYRFMERQFDQVEIDGVDSPSKDNTSRDNLNGCKASQLIVIVFTSFMYSIHYPILITLFTYVHASSTLHNCNVSFNTYLSGGLQVYSTLYISFQAKFDVSNKLYFFIYSVW